MVSRRPVILMGILLVLVLAYVARPLWGHAIGLSPMPNAESPLPGPAAVSSLTVRRDADGRWLASIEYFHTGAPAHAILRVGALSAGSGAPQPGAGGLLQQIKPAVRGRQKVEVEVLRPSHPKTPTTAFPTSHVVAMLVAGDTVLAQQVLPQAIEWPDQTTWYHDRSVVGRPTQDLLAEAIRWIDEGGHYELGRAKHTLERLVVRDPKLAQAFIELARVAMKSNWGPEGLRHAESLLASAQQIEPGNVNAKVLLGYVYTHQGRHREAEALFADAAQANPPNLWLWANWGEVLALQGKTAPAIEKYREAVARPRSNDTYDRARLDAYQRLLALHAQRKEIDAMEALHRRRVEEYGAGSCFGAEHAQFLLSHRADAAEAIRLARRAMEGGCAAPVARETLGLAHYLTWATREGSAAQEALNQARVYLPGGPRLVLRLAGSDAGAVALKRLLAAGERIDERDNEGFGALAHALAGGELATATRLLKLGARTDQPSGPDELPVAFIPVVNGDIAGVRLMQRFGVDYTKLRYRGTTAIEHAREVGDRRLMEALDPKARML